MALLKYTLRYVAYVKFDRLITVAEFEVAFNKKLQYIDSSNYNFFIIANMCDHLVKHPSLKFTWKQMFCINILNNSFMFCLINDDKFNFIKIISLSTPINVPNIFIMHILMLLSFYHQQVNLIWPACVNVTPLYYVFLWS